MDKIDLGIWITLAFVSFLLGGMLAWNFAVHKLSLDIEHGYLLKDGCKYRIEKIENEKES